MTKKLEELFNLPPISEAIAAAIEESTPISNDVATQEMQEAKETLVAADNAFDKIDAALPTVHDLDTSDTELDEIADLAKDTFKDLIDLAMNVEPRFSGPIIQSASTLLGHAVTAKVAKMDKKLKMIDLQLKKLRIDKMETKDPAAKALEGEGVVLDRNELLRQILNQSKDK